MINKLTDELINDLNNKLDNIIIEGLKLKGFEFCNKSQLENFINQHCMCFDDSINREKTYYVYGEPFLLHCYALPPLELPLIINGKFEVKASLGKYTYL